MLSCNVSPFGVPVFSALFGGLIAYAATNYFNIKTAQNELVKDYINELKEIEKLSIKYWLGDHKNNKEELQNVGVELLARLTATGYFVERAKKNGAIVQSLYGRFKYLDGILYDFSTGGNFQTAKMAANADTANKIIQTISEITSLLRESRISRYWAH